MVVVCVGCAVSPCESQFSPSIMTVTGAAGERVLMFVLRERDCCAGLLCPHTTTSAPPLCTVQSVSTTAKLEGRFTTSFVESEKAYKRLRMFRVDDVLVQF